MSYLKENDKSLVSSIKKEEKGKIDGFNTNKFDYDNDKVYHVEFSKIAMENPDKCALIFNNNKISYKQLDIMSNSLAYHLRKKYDIQRNNIIPIICNRSYYFVVAALSVLKAGGAFVYVDPEYPKDRIQYMFKEVEAKIVLKYLSKGSNSSSYEYYDSEFSVSCLNLERHDYTKNTDKLPNINESNDLCCLFFTSGTTGQPKGSLITHDNFVNVNYFGFSNNEKRKMLEFNSILAYTKFSFNVSILELFFPLLNRGMSILCNDDEYNNPSRLSHIINMYHPEHIIAIPTRIKNYIKNEDFRKSMVNVKFLTFGGETVTHDFLKEILGCTKATLCCAYGITETSSICAFNKLKQEDILNDEPIAVGYPNGNTEIYILDKYLNPVPVGMEGEIYVGGRNVSNGYLNREELTEKAFIPKVRNIDKNYGKIYKTGDIGKWTKDGRIIHMGRIDFQVKIRGQRIELSEIEHLVKAIDKIEDAIVIDQINENGEKYLIGYYITESKSSITNKDIMNFLKTKLPLYMVPQYFVKIDSIPMTSNGKLDKKRLPQPDINEMIADIYEAPKTPFEKKLCDVFGSVLNIDVNKIGRNHCFFELGGDSMTGIKVVSKIEKEIKVKLNIKDILSSSISDLSKHMEELIIESVTQMTLHRDNNTSMFSNDNGNEIKKHNSKEFPVTSQQLGVYIDSIKNPNSILYNNPVSFKLNKNINIAKIKESFQKIFQNQEILRSKYYEKEVNGKLEVYGYIDDTCSLMFEDYDSNNFNEFIRPFNLSTAPLIRIGFINQEKLLIDMHHIITDGTSLSIVIEELNNYYYNNTVEALEFQFSDYAISFNENYNKGLYDDQINFYESMFNESYDTLNLPKKEQTKFTNNSESESGKQKNLTKLVPRSMKERIENFIKANGVSKTSFFFSIYCYVLSKYSSQNSVYSSIVTSNRNNFYTENMIGMFSSTQPILVKFDEKISFMSNMKQITNTLLNIYSNQDISFSELSKKLNLKNVNNAFVFQPKEITNVTVNENVVSVNNKNGNLFSMLENTNVDSKFELTIHIMENNDNYMIYAEYNSDVYEYNMINNILESYLEVIKSMDLFIISELNKVNYIPKEEKNRILYEFNNNHYEYEFNKLYHTEFSKVAKSNPNNIAIIFNEMKITFRKLDEMTNSLAHYLRSQGIGRDDIIPIITERSFYYIVAFIAVMKSGAAYLSIDPEFPKERIEYMMSEVNAKFILKYVTDSDNNKKINEIEGVKSYELHYHNYEENIHEIDNINSSDDICYVLFTSGTTGKPKGTLTTHNN
ncbi:hypothetical protein PIROE2DRAFT_8097, partial [Piromyces sp. E2]